MLSLDWHTDQKQEEIAGLVVSKASLSNEYRDKCTLLFHIKTNNSANNVCVSGERRRSISIVIESPPAFILWLFTSDTHRLPAHTYPRTISHKYSTYLYRWMSRSSLFFQLYVVGGLHSAQVRSTAYLILVLKSLLYNLLLV